MPPLTEELGLVRASAMAIINSGTITDEQRHTLSDFTTINNNEAMFMKMKK